MAENFHDIEAALTAGMEIGEPKRVTDGGEYALYRAGDRLHDLEFLLDYPRRIRGTITTHTPGSFVSYFNHYNEHDENHLSAIFADQSSVGLTGIIDYHGVNNGWAQHRVVYTAPRSTEWATWTGKNKRAVTQTDFAQFIEDNVADINSPSGADMLEIARNLQAKKEVSFSSAIRLSTGDQEFAYSEVVQGSSAKGTLSVPEEFTIAIPVFRDDARYAVKARLRYRIDGGKLMLWYDLYRPDLVESDAFKKLVDQVATDTKIAESGKLWYGEPPEGN